MKTANKYGGVAFLGSPKSRKVCRNFRRKYQY